MWWDRTGELQVAIILLLRGSPGTGKSTVAKGLARDHGWDVVELDEIKVRYYGTTERCDDVGLVFNEGGLQAKERIDLGHNVVGVEQFLSQGLMDLFLRPMGLQTTSSNVHTIWLGCDPEVAVARKERELSADVVRASHRAALERQRVSGEVELDTTSLLPSMVLERVVQELRRRGLT